jgi:hypothetical protein
MKVAIQSDQAGRYKNDRSEGTKETGRNSLHSRTIESAATPPRTAQSGAVSTWKMGVCNATGIWPAPDRCIGVGQEMKTRKREMGF